MAHRTESLAAPYYDQLKQMYEHLSGGVTFHDSGTIQRYQIANAFKRELGEDGRELTVHDITRDRINAWLKTLRVSVTIPTPDTEVEDLRKARAENHEGFSRDFEGWKKNPGKGFEDYFEELASAYGPLAIRQHRTDIAGLAIRHLRGETTLDDLEGVLWSTTNTVVSELLSRAERSGMTDTEANALIEKFFQSKVVKELPFVQITAALVGAHAASASAQQAKPPNRGFAYDLEVIRSLLPYCDAMFIDNECRRYLTMPQVAAKLPCETKLFSLDNQQEFLEYIEEVEKRMTKEHLEKVNEVYGAGRLKPFTEMFDLEKSS